MSVNRGMDKEVVRVHHGRLLSHGKELSNATAATWTDLQMIILSRTEKGKPHAMSLACGP